ncbi:MAG: hypothetical protein ACI9PP_002113 [Halobacteriales archaeon]|jgi:uncharacterized protein YyaL (SSP411 family)
MSDPTARNRLDEEASPYLRQHADNPVNWQPWDKDALAAARERDVPIFLSVGYSACHWCHVMEDESFEDDSIAELLNEDFVPMKVDREERPDLDRLYQTVAQLTSGRGGWPLSVFLTPEGEPFYVGTYFPPEPKRGMPGFQDLLGRIRDSWNDREERQEMERRAKQWTRAMDDQLEATPDQRERPADDFLIDAADTALRGADREYGGWGSGGPKFPQPVRIDLLLRGYDRTGTDAYRAVAIETLDAMADGGMYDHVGGGFHRYATDREWTVPHFEKMLYDNAELPRRYLAGYQLTGEDRYAAVVRETFAFLERELRHPDGGFFSTLDAQSVPPDAAESADADDGEAVEMAEGAFYVWTPAGIQATVENDLAADLFCDRYGITEGGNFEGGTTVLTIDADIGTLADDYDLPPDEVRQLLDVARKAVFDARERRPRPRRDEKVIAGWNGLVISALAEGALVLDAKYADIAADALGFVREHLWDEDAERLARHSKDGEVKGEGYLEDYAFLARGAFDLYQVTGEVEHLAFAMDLAAVMREEFWDDEAGTLFFTPTTGEALVTRPQELRDQSTPSSTGVAADVLLSLDHFRRDDVFHEIAEAVVETHGTQMESSPLEYATLTRVADRLSRGDLELTLVADEIPAQWREELAATFMPDRLLAPRPATDKELESWLDTLGLDSAPPIWANREARNGEPTVYACRDFTCSPPETDLRSALDWARSNVGAES